MSDLGTVLQQLRRERDRVKSELQQLDQAIQALTKVCTKPRGKDSIGRPYTTRKISAAARRRIAAAQRARWAKFRAAKGKVA